MAYANLRYDVDGPVATVTIDRPERRNAQSWDTVRELRAALDMTTEDAAEGVAAFAERRPPRRNGR